MTVCSTTHLHAYDYEGTYIVSGLLSLAYV